MRKTLLLKNGKLITIYCEETYIDKSFFADVNGLVVKQNGYLTVRVNGCYEYLSRLLYEHRGETLPSGINVKFKDGDKHNFMTWNLTTR